MNETTPVPTALQLLVKSLSDEIEARFEKSFAQRNDELVRLRSEVILLKNEAALTLDAAQRYLDEVEDKLEDFTDTTHFQNAVNHQITVAFKTDDKPDLNRRISSTLRDLISRTRIVIPTE